MKTISQTLNNKLNVAKNDYHTGKQLSALMSKLMTRKNEDVYGTKIAHLHHDLQNGKYSGKNKARATKKLQRMSKNYNLHTNISGFTAKPEAIRNVIKQHPSLGDRLGCVYHSHKLLDKKTHKPFSFRKLEGRNETWISRGQAPQLISHYQHLQKAFRPWNSQEISDYASKRAKHIQNNIKMDTMNHQKVWISDTVERDEFSHLATDAKKYHLKAYGISVIDGSTADHLYNKDMPKLQTSPKQLKHDIFNLSKLDRNKQSMFKITGLSTPTNSKFKTRPHKQSKLHTKKTKLLHKQINHKRTHHINRNNPSFN